MSKERYKWKMETKKKKNENWYKNKFFGNNPNRKENYDFHTIFYYG